MDGLMTARICPAHRGLDLFFLIAGTVRIGVAMDEPHDIGLVGCAAFGVHMELNSLSRLHGNTVAIAGDTQCRHTSLLTNRGLVRNPIRVK